MPTGILGCSEKVALAPGMPDCTCCGAPPIYLPSPDIRNSASTSQLTEQGAENVANSALETTFEGEPLASSA
jgi:hypothetical protein